MLNLTSTRIPSLYGSDRGYSVAADIVTRTADGRPLDGIWTELNAVLAMHNAHRQRLIDFLTFPVTNPVEGITPSNSGSEFEEASEFGVPKSIRGTASAQWLGYGFKDYDLAKRFTWKFLRDASAQQVENIHNEAMAADNRNIFRNVMRAIFNNVNEVATIDNAAVNVYRLYNGDGSVPPATDTKQFDGTHNHYLVSGGALIDSEDLEVLVGHIEEHGFTASSGVNFVIMVNKAQGAAIRMFKAGETNNNGKVAMYDFVPSLGEPRFLLPENRSLVNGSQAPAQIAGMTVIGSYGHALIVEEDYIPAGYVLCFATGGEANLRNPVGFRQHADPSYQGLLLIPGDRPGYPLIDSYYTRGFGTGIRQRGGAAVMQIKASGTYDIPTVWR